MEIARQVVADLGLEGRHSVSGGRNGQPLVINRLHGLSARQITLDSNAGKITIQREEFRTPTFLERITGSHRQGPLEYGSRLWLKALFASVLVMLYAPILTLMAFSFNDSKRNIVWQGFTLKYYVVAWNNTALFDAMVNSITIALLCTIFATVIGAATALQRYY